MSEKKLVGIDFVFAYKTKKKQNMSPPLFPSVCNMGQI